MNDLVDLEKDIANLTRTELRKKYGLTYDSWKNGKARAGKRGHWSSEFDDFVSFLRYMGPRPANDYTLDRTNNDDPHYGPGLCEWKQKSSQSNNRRTTITIENTEGRQPLTEFANEIGQSPSGVRKAFYRGAYENSEWTIGQPSNDGSPFGRDPRQYQPWPYRDNPPLRTAWEREYKKHASIGTNRFEFLLNRLARQIAKIQKKLDTGVFDPDVDKSELEAANRARAITAEAERQYTAWIKEAKMYDRRIKREKNKLIDWDVREGGDDD